MNLALNLYEIPNNEQVTMGIVAQSRATHGEMLWWPLGNALHSGSQHGCSWMFPAGKHLGSVDKGLEAQHTSPHAAALASPLADISSVP